MTTSMDISTTKTTVEEGLNGGESYPYYLPGTWAVMFGQVPEPFTTTLREVPLYPFMLKDTFGSL